VTPSISPPSKPKLAGISVRAVPCGGLGFKFSFLAQITQPATATTFYTLKVTFRNIFSAPSVPNSEVTLFGSISTGATIDSTNWFNACSQPGVSYNYNPTIVSVCLSYIDENLVTIDQDLTINNQINIC
jgi:hypothetical protein